MENQIADNQNKKWYDNKFVVHLLLIVFFPVGLYALWNARTIAQWWKITATVILGIMIIFSFPEDKQSKVSESTKKDEKNNDGSNINIKEIEYEIISKEDLSRKATGDNSLSEYSTKELQDLPEIKKFQYHVVVGYDISSKQVKPTVKEIVKDITKKDPEIDEIIIELYSDEGLAGTKGDIATLHWAPDGDLGNTTPQIARSNDRSRHELLVYKKKENLSSYLEQRGKNEKKLGLSEEKRKEIYRALVKAEDKAIEIADKRFSIGSKKHTEAITRLTKKYHQEVYDEYDITENQADKIGVEAIEENWATPE